MAVAKAAVGRVGESAAEKGVEEREVGEEVVALAVAMEAEATVEVAKEAVMAEGRGRRWRRRRRYRRRRRRWRRGGWGGGGGAARAAAMVAERAAAARAAVGAEAGLVATRAEAVEVTEAHG